MIKDKFLNFISSVLDLAPQFVTFLMGWAENLLDNIISIKVWMLGICVYLVHIDKLTGGEFITAFLAVIGLREGYKIARSYLAPRNGGEDADLTRKLNKI
ncbi:MAG: hypothetical protein WC169_11835 [Dehalococcoidia bacterium]|jgi:hypothetical protein